MTTAQTVSDKAKGIGVKNLALVKAETPSAEAESERIALLEMLPKKEWFIRTTFRGKAMWYVRFSVTGIRARIFGPFPTKRAGLLFLDAAHDKLADLWSEVDDVAKQYSCRGEFQFVGWGSIIEHPLAVPRKKGR